MKLKDALAAFLLVDRAKQTRETYEKFLRRFVNAIGPERQLQSIRPEDIAEFVDEMRNRTVKYEDHGRRPAVQEPLSTVTVYKNVKMIKTFFKWCVDHHHLAESPADFLVNKKPVRPLGQGKACTDEELELLLAAARFKPRDLALVTLLAESGCRAGEAATLRIQDLELDLSSAMVTGKGDIRRRIYFFEDTTEALSAWLAIRPKAAHDYVFLTLREHTPLSSRAVSQVIRRLSKFAGLKRMLGAHSLRHRVGLTFARERVAPRVAQHYLGHTNIKTTLEYYQDIDESDLRTAGRLLNWRRAGWQEEAKQNPAAKLLKPRTGS
jgi:site-specific recombinase XerD